MVCQALMQLLRRRVYLHSIQRSIFTIALRRAQTSTKARRVPFVLSDHHLFIKIHELFAEKLIKFEKNKKTNTQSRNVKESEKQFLDQSLYPDTRICLPWAETPSSKL